MSYYSSGSFDRTDSESIADSNYTTTSSVFSRASLATVATTAPFRPGPRHHDWFDNETHQDPHNQGGDLWCEFCVVADCGVTFQLNEETAWINHHLTHLNHTLPGTLVCWFCDDYKFSVDQRAPADDRRRNFVNRMGHIHGHIQEDERLTVNSMRPDYNMADHMYQNRLIDEHMWRAYRSYTEVPPQLRIPGTPGSASYDRYQHGQNYDQSQRGGPLTPLEDDGWYRSPRELVREERRRRRLERSHR